MSRKDSVSINESIGDIQDVTLVDRLGGEEGLQSIVRVFYGKVVDDITLKHLFLGVNLVK